MILHIIHRPKHREAIVLKTKQEVMDLVREVAGNSLYLSSSDAETIKNLLAVNMLTAAIEFFNRKQDSSDYNSGFLYYTFEL